MDVLLPKDEPRSVPPVEVKEGPVALIPWEAEATLQGTFKMKVSGKAPFDIEVIHLVEDLVEPLVVEALLNTEMDIKPSQSGETGPSTLDITFTDKAGQVLTLKNVHMKGETDPKRLFVQSILPRLIAVISEAEYHVVGLNKHK